MNNNAEYEILILGLRTTIELKIERFMIYNDSLLIMNQVLSIYQYHNELFMSYSEEVVNQ